MAKNNQKQNKQRANNSRKGAGMRGGKTPSTVASMSLGGRIPYGFPPQMLTKLRYYDTYALTVTSGSLGKQVMRWNSTFDPDYTGVGHQPLYRDTFAAIYDHYAVISATANVKFVNTATSPIIVGVVTDDDNSASTSVQTLIEQPTGQHEMLPPLSGSLSAVTFNPTWDYKRVLGTDPYSSQEAKTPVGSNPVEDSDLHIWGTTLDATSATIYVSVEMVFTCLWTELQTPVQS